MLPGKIWKILVKEGDSVEAGQVVLVIESMKTENEMEAESAGVVKEILVKEGDAVQIGQKLMTIE